MLYEVITLVNNITGILDPSQLADTVAAHFAFKIQDKQELLESVAITERLTLLLRLVITSYSIHYTKLYEGIRAYRCSFPSMNSP